MIKPYESARKRMAITILYSRTAFPCPGISSWRSGVFKFGDARRSALQCAKEKVTQAFAERII